MPGHARHSLVYILLSLVGCATDSTRHNNYGESTEAACARLVMDYALYRDQFVKTAQGWKIARREFVPRVTFQ